MKICVYFQSEKKYLSLFRFWYLPRLLIINKKIKRDDNYEKSEILNKHSSVWREVHTWVSHSLPTQTQPPHQNSWTKRLLLTTFLNEYSLFRKYLCEKCCGGLIGQLLVGMLYPINTPIDLPASHRKAAADAPHSVDESAGHRARAVFPERAWGKRWHHNAG